MKLKYKFAIRQVCGVWAAVPVGEDARKYQGVISLNETAADMMKYLQEEISEEELTARMLADYEVPEEALRKDVTEFLNQLRSEQVLC